MIKLTQLMLTFMILFGGTLGLAPAASDVFSKGTSNVEVVHAGSTDVFSGKKINASGTNAEAKGLIDKIRNAANVFAAIVLAISIIMVIVGALKYILANGNPKSAEEGKMVLIYAGIGIVIALSAFALARLAASFSF